MSGVDWSTVVHFAPEEFECACGCGRNEMQPDFIRKLDDLRSRFDFPFVVTSGYRCPDHNAKVSTTGRDGPHTTGRAVDLSLFGRRAFLVIRQASLFGFMTGLGLNQRGQHEKRFVHLDDLEAGDGRYRPTVWTY